MMVLALRGYPAKTLAICLAILMTQPMWAATPTYIPQLPDPGSVGITKEQQIQIGRKAMAEVYKQMPVLPDSSPETQYVQQLGRRLAAVIPAQYSWPYEFHVIPQKEINAFALPGGPMFVNIGAITAADNEAQLAGVMAHEMSHVYMQHSAKQASKTRWADMLGALGGLFGSGVGSLARLGIELGAGTLLMRYSRHDESQADAVGAIIMYKAGYDPKALADFFQKIEGQSGGSGPQFLSDHPNPGNREAAIDKEIKTWPPKNYIRDTEDFVRVKKHANTVRTYTGQEIADGAKQGVWNRPGDQTHRIPSVASAVGSLSNLTFDQVRPSSRSVQWRNDAFSISYPENWQASDQGRSTTIASPSAVADGTVAYGVLIELTNQRPDSLVQATQDLINGLQQSNPGLRVTQRTQNIQVSGEQGQSVTLTGYSPVQRNGQPIPERDWLVTLLDPQGNLDYVLFIAPEGDFGEISDTYQRMLTSFRLINF
ncbi:MAG: hypothetical protein NVS1B11_03870 [Terriglobales bacterium]